MRPYRLFRKAVVRLRLDVRNASEDGIDIHVAAALSTLAQISLGVDGREFFGDGTADELVDGNTLRARETPGVLMNGIW